MKTIVLVRLRKEEFEDTDGTERNNRLRDRLQDESDNIREIKLEKRGTWYVWQGYIDEE